MHRVGGGIANTFLAATGFNVGASLYEKDYMELAQQLMTNSKNIVFDLPKDVVVVKHLKQQRLHGDKYRGRFSNDIIIDVGTKTCSAIMKQFKQ